MKPSFDVCVITKNGARTLPRLAESLHEFLERGGTWIVCDTGSTDGTPDVARSLGAQVTEAGERFMITIDADLAQKINERFVVDGESPIVEGGNRYFHFAQARNFCANLATNDWVAWIDSDEAFVRLDIDKINEAMSNPDVSLLEYNFCYAWQRPPEVGNPNDLGIPAVEFVQAKTFRRSRMSWGTLPVHELATPLPSPASGGMGRAFLPKELFYLGHWQQPSDHRSNYLVGLSVACYQDPEHDRESHYLGREMAWTGRAKSAIKELTRHIAMNGWPAERAESMIFVADCYGQIGEPEQQREWYLRAFDLDPTRRKALLRLAEYYKAKDKWHAVAAFAGAALQIPWHPYYANQVADYRERTHKILYAAKGWTGDIAGAQEHLLKALEYNQYDGECLRDSKYYFEYGDQGIEGWMWLKELQWLYNTAKTVKTVCELGSWKGRSTHALCSGALKNDGHITAVDHFQGSVDCRDGTHEAALHTDVYGDFCKNTAQFKNLTVVKKPCEEAASDFPNGSFDCLFVDAGHDRESVLRDVRMWRNKAKKILCGHDYFPGWPELKAAIDEEVGEVEVVGTIWIKRLEPRPVQPLLAYLTHCVHDGLPVSFVKKGDGEQACMDGEKGANCDGHPYTPELGWKLRMAFSELEKMSVQREGRTWVNVVPFSDQPFYNILLHRNDSDIDPVTAFWNEVRVSTRRKLFIGPARLKPAADMLKCDFVEIPLVDAFSEYDAIREKLRWDAKPDTIFVFCAGMSAKAWIASLLLAEPKVTCIDAGSAWDPMFVGKTRTEQLPMEFLQRHYAEWLL